MSSFYCSPLLWVMLLSLLGGCHRKPQANMHNACDLFKEDFSWYRYHNNARRSHGIPIWMQLAFIHMESKFDPYAVPIKEKRHGRIIKTWSSAQGYAQALNGVWSEYISARPSWLRSRNYYKDSTDFIGWYLHRCHKQAGIAKNDPYNMYLCYHEGIQGYKSGSYKKKKPIIAYARKTDLLARSYHKQLQQCELSLRLQNMYFL